MPATHPVSRPFRRIRFVFAILAALVVLTTILIASAQIRDSYESIIETEERAARNLLRSGESHASQVFKETRRLLDGIGTLYLDRQRLDDFDEAVFHDLLKASVESADFLSTAYLADKDGFFIAAGNTFPLDEFSMSVSVIDTNNISTANVAFHLESLKQSSMGEDDTEGGRWFLPAVLPLEDGYGVVQGYAMGGVDPSVFEEFYSQMEVGQHGIVHLWDQRGMLVAGNQNSPWTTGDVVKGMDGWMAEFAMQDGVDTLKTFTADRDGVPVVSTQLGVENFQFGLAVTMDGRDFLASWQQARLQIILEAVVFLLVLGALAFVMLRQLRQLEAGEQRIRDAKNEAERANKVKVQFLAQVSHEFRTPLNAIIGFSQAIRDRVLGVSFDQKYTEYADDIYNSGRHLLDLVNDIIDFSKIEAGEYQVNRTRVSVNTCIDETISMMSVQAQGRQIKLCTEFAEPDAWLETDQRLLKQVLINLIANAIKFSDVGSEVTVSVQRIGNGVEFVVSDQGQGMSESLLGRIGEPFLVESSQTQAEGQGSGLGLSIAKMCMDLMGGTLSVRSTEGKGTDASILFPAFLSK